MVLELCLGYDTSSTPEHHALDVPTGTADKDLMDELDSSTFEGRIVLPSGRQDVAFLAIQGGRRHY